MKTSCLRLKLVELNFFASFNADDQRKTYVSNVSKYTFKSSRWTFSITFSLLSAKKNLYAYLKLDKVFTIHNFPVRIPHCVTIFQFPTPPMRCCHFTNSSAIRPKSLCCYKFQRIQAMTWPCFHWHHYTNIGQSVNLGQVRLSCLCNQGGK